MTYSVQITPAAQRQIRTLDPQVAKRVRMFLEGTLRGIDNPRSLGKPLIGRELWRYPVGD